MSMLRRLHGHTWTKGNLVMLQTGSQAKPRQGWQHNQAGSMRHRAGGEAQGQGMSPGAVGWQSHSLGRATFRAVQLAAHANPPTIETHGNHTHSTTSNKTCTLATGGCTATDNTQQHVQCNTMPAQDVKPSALAQARSTSTGALRQARTYPQRRWSQDRRQMSSFAPNTPNNTWPHSQPLPGPLQTKHTAEGQRTLQHSTSQTTHIHALTQDTN